MKMGKGLNIVITTAFLVGLFSLMAGLSYGLSIAAYGFAEIYDVYADSFAELVGSENVQDMRDKADDLRIDQMKNHADFTLYLLLAVGIGAGGAIWMAWSIHKEREELVSAPAPSPTPSSEIPPLK